MKLDIPLPLWVVMVLLALCTGVVLGSFAPVPATRTATVAADAVGEAPEPAAPAAAAQPRAGRSATEEGFEEDDAETGSPIPGWERVAQGPGAIAPGTDTLPAAPLTDVALARPHYLTASAAPPAERGRSVIRITDARTEPPASRSRAASASSADPCAGVIRDASAPDPTGCRRAAERRLEAMCPEARNPNYDGPIICIRGH